MLSGLQRTNRASPLGRALGVAAIAALASACSVGSPRVTGEGIPCSSSSQCTSGETCFLGECRGASAALGTVLAEVRPPPGGTYGVLQVGAIDLRSSVLVDFALQPSLGVAGDVEQLLGSLPALGSSPVSGADVTFACRDHVIPNRPLQVTAQAINGGLFSARLPVGTWDATVVPPSPLPPLYSALGLDTGAPQLELLLPSSSALLRVQGQVSAGAPLAGARVLAVDGNGLLLAAAATADATGSFQLVLPPSATSFDLRVGPDSDLADGGAVASELPNYAAVGPFSADAGTLSFDLGAPPPAATLSGVVLDSAGQPVTGARVYALSLDGSGYVLSSSALSDALGTFQLPLLAGKFAVEAAPPSSDASAPGLSSELDLELGAPGMSIDISCPARVQASGQLLQADGTAVPPGTQISATRLPDRLVTGRVAQTQPTDAKGNFTIVADAGSYRLVITPPAGSGLPSTQVVVDIEANTVSLPTIQLAPPLQVVGTITGTQAAGAPGPIAGATVEFFALDSTGQTALSLGSGLTDSSGHYLAVLPDVETSAAANTSRR